MNSGLDTESIVSALVSTTAAKKDKYKKMQTKLSWKQDAWKSLNTKVYKMYTNVGNLRLSTAYNLKSTKVSDSTKATVSGSSTAPNGEQKLNIIQTARAGYLTGGQLASNTRANSTLAELGYIGGEASIDVSIGEGANKQTKSIKVSQGTTVTEFVNSLKDAGLSANYDSANQRIFVNSKESGTKGDFSLVGSNMDGFNALSALGLNVKSDATNAAYSAYAKYYDAYDATMRSKIETSLTAYKDAKTASDTATAQNTNLAEAYGYASAYGDMMNALKSSSLSKADQDRLLKLLKMSSAERSSTVMDADGNIYNKKLDHTDGTEIYSTTLANGSEKLLQKVTTYTGSDGKEYKLDADKNYTANGKTYVATDKKDDDGNVIYKNKDDESDTITISSKTDYYEVKAKVQKTGIVSYTDDEGKSYKIESKGSEYYIKEDGTRYKRRGGAADGSFVYVRKILSSGQEDSTLVTIQNKVEEEETVYEKVLVTPVDANSSQNVLNDLKANSRISDEDFSKLVTTVGKVANYENATDSVLPADDEFSRASIIKKVAEKYNEGGTTAVSELTNTYADRINNNKEIIENAKTVMEEHSALSSMAKLEDSSDIDAAITSFMTKVKSANEILTSDNFNEGAKKIDGRNSIIKLNGVEYTGSSNVFSINGLNITAQAETGDGDENAITITTNTDTQGIYDKIKDFINQYNDLVNEITSLYNADSAKGFEPLTDDEKDQMSEKEAEKYEQKIKDSILRRDSSLYDILNAMTSSMTKGVSIDGKNYSLLDLGIQTLGFMKAAKNEQNAYHIAGDEDDAATSGMKDKLMAMINEDPDKVMQIMQGVTKNLYDEIGKKMKSTNMRSMYTVYNDKQMQKEYDEYTKQIKKWEEKVESLEDYYYKKFTAMEKALASINSQNSSLSGLFGQ